VRGQKIDRQLTASKHFLDERSFCNLRGETFLYGEDVGVMRDAVLARDRFRCVHCWSTRNLQMHHRKHRGQGGSDDLENLETICAPCHSQKHVRVHFGSGVV